MTFGTGVALAAGIAYAFLNSDPDASKKKKHKTGSSDRKRSAVSGSKSSNGGKHTRRANTTAGSDNDDDDDNIDTTNFRGYKQTSTGQKTTYFNRELSAQDKALLGDSTPKRIDSTAAAGASPIACNAPLRLSDSPSPLSAVDTSPNSPSTAAMNNTNSSSAWNTAGTWEEKDVTSWASARLRDLLSSLSCSSSGDEVVCVSVSSVVRLEGDASIAVARGKRKNIYDFTAELEWKLTSARSVQSSGSASVGDITAACEHEVVCRCNGPGALTAARKSSLQELVLTKNSKLKQELNRILREFAAEFAAKPM